MPRPPIRSACAVLATILMYTAPNGPVHERASQDVAQRSTPPASPSGDIERLYGEGQSSLERGDLDRAEADFQKVLAVNPQVAGAWANLGVIAMRRKRWDHALDLLHKADKLAPDVPGVRLNIGLVYFREEMFRPAIAAFESVVRDAPGSRQARYLLGLCYFFKERYADAATTLEPLWDAESNNLSYLYVIGIAAGRAKRADLEARALGRLVEVGGGTAQFHLLMGKADLNRQEPEKALVELRQAETADPNLPFLHFNLGLAYLATNKYDQSREEFLKDVAIEPDVAWNYDELGTLYLQQNDNAKAEQYFYEALKRDPNLASSRFGLGEIYQRQGKFKQALAALDLAESLAPESSNVHYVRARVLAHLGRSADAKLEFAEAERLRSASHASEDQIRTGMTLSEAPTPNPELMKDPQ